MLRDAHRDIDIKYPGPGVGVGDPSAKGRPEGRPEDDAETVEAHRRCLFFHGERLPQYRLRQGYEGTAPDALNNTEATIEGRSQAVPQSMEETVKTATEKR